MDTTQFIYAFMYVAITQSIAFFLSTYIITGSLFNKYNAKLFKRMAYTFIGLDIIITLSTAYIFKEIFMK